MDDPQRQPPAAKGRWDQGGRASGELCLDGVDVKYGTLQQEAFKEPGGEALLAWIDDCPNQDYSALTYQGGAVWRKRLMDDLGDQGPVSALIDRRSDDNLAALTENLGGNCVETMAQIFASIDHDNPVCVLGESRRRRNHCWCCERA